jgi:signal transduction histidine kinase
MSAPPVNEITRLPAGLRALPAVAGGVAVCVGLLVLVGWHFDIEPLKRTIAGYVAMNPLTAVLFIFSGLALAIFLGFPNSRHAVWVTRILALLVVWFGLTKLAGLREIAPPYVDTWLFASKLKDLHDQLPNRMAPNTAVNFIVTGLALLGLGFPMLRLGLVQACAIFVGFGALLPVTGYAYGVHLFTGIASFIPMAMHTAGTFLVLAFGLFFAIPEAPLAQIFASDDPAGVIARRLLPSSVLLTLFLGWLCLWGERHGYYEDALGMALFAIVLSLMFVALVRWTVGTVSNLERERAATQARLDDVNRRKDEMIAFVSHDLSSPLTGLRLVVDSLREENSRPAEDLLEMMDHSVRRMVSMVRGLLDVAKLQPADEVRLEYSDFRISERVRQSMEPLAINANAKQIHFQLDVAPDEPVIRADALRVTQIFNNLLSNAVKFTQTGGSIVVTIEPAHAGVRVRVKDSGPGISENDLPHVFDKYFQGSTKATAGEAGTGLGLAIVRQMVLLHDGYIDVASDPGEGATFTVFLPTGAPAHASA